jgi:protein TonB
VFLLAFLSVQTTFAQNTNQVQKIDSSIIVDFPDVEARFPGGPKALHKWFQENLVFPDVAIELDNQYIVYVQFVIEIDGSITNIRLAKKLHEEEFNSEAKRLMSIMPKWIPAEVKGVPVRSRCLLPIHFLKYHL